MMSFIKFLSSALGTEISNCTYVALGLWLCPVAPGGAPVPGRPAVPFVALGTPAAVRVGTASTAYFAASGRSRLCALVRRLCALVIPQPLTFSACMESRACLANRAGLKILTASASHP